MGRYGLPADSTAGQFLEVREAESHKALQEVGGPGRALGGAGGTVVHVCVFNEQARLTEIKIHPLEQVGGDLMTFDSAIPRFRRGLPLMLDAESPISEAVLKHAAEASAIFGTAVEVRDGVGIVRFG
jgi:hypothetical protein